MIVFPKMTAQLNVLETVDAGGEETAQADGSNNESSGFGHLVAEQTNVNGNR